MPLISVVMPAYNAEKYIVEAIESVLQQTFHDWELIIVDDCSQDNTFYIAQDFSKKDSRIKTYRLNSNSGSAYIPRKKAIELSQSDWIVGLDADDYLETEDLDKLYDRMNETKAEIVLHQLIRVADDRTETGEKCPDSDFKFNRVLSGKEACSLTIGQWIINGNGLFKKELYNKIWKQQQIDYAGMNGDEFLTRQLFLSATTVALCTAKYFYRINSKSITQDFSIKSFDILQTNALLKKLVLSDFGKGSKEAVEMSLQQWNGVRYCSMLLFDKRKSISKENKIKIERKIYNEWKELEWNIIRPHLKVKLLSQLLSWNFVMYKSIIKSWISVKCIK